jgi:hypothetical protein
MQPNSTPENQVPNQPSQVPTTPPVATAPVVTMAPDQPQSTASMQPPVQASPNSEATPPSVVPTAQSAQPVDETLIRWRGAEYIHHDKDAIWFTVFAVVTLALMAVAVFVLQDISFSILIPVMAAALVVYTRRSPRVLDYTLSRQGLHINDRLYPFAEFKSFGVIHDAGEYSVMLIPTKRFKSGVTIYFPEESGEAIVDMLGARLPMQELKLDLVDRLIRKLRI